MNITLVISSLSSGGAERVLTLLAQGLAQRGHQVTVVTLFGTRTDFYRLPEGVRRRALDIAGESPTVLHAIRNNLRRLRKLRQAVRSTRPDVVISFQDRTNVLTSLSVLGTGYTLIATEHLDPSMVPGGRVWKWLRRLTYPRLAKVVSVSLGVDQYFGWLPESQRSVIYNPLTPIERVRDSAGVPAGADPSKKWIVAMGRLAHQKGFDLLLSAFHMIAERHPGWQLLILGEGELRRELERLIERLGLTERVCLPGLISNPFPVLRRAELFVMSSRYEGFGNVLIEALACGLPVIATDCPSGPSEIVRDGVDGILVPNEDVSALAAAMDQLMSDEHERKRLAARAPEVADRFGLEKIMGMWEELLDQVLGNS